MFGAGLHEEELPRSGGGAARGDVLREGGEDDRHRETQAQNSVQILITKFKFMPTVPRGGFFVLQKCGRCDILDTSGNIHICGGIFYEKTC